MTALLRYDAACKAIAEAKSVDEVKDVRNRADALRLYARQARNREAEITMAEIRFRAERRIGEIKRELRDAGELHEGGRPSKTPVGNTEVSKVRLSDLDIDENMSRRVDKLADYEPDAFERLVARWRGHQEREANRVSLNLLKEDSQAKAQAENAASFVGGCSVDDLYRLIEGGRKFKTILADPPWKFIARSDKGEGRSAGQHYRTDVLEAIKALPIAQLADDDCVLLMWMVDWCPKWAFEIIEAWGFVHKTTAFTWAKQNESGEGWHMGQGYWTRANPEDCWLATRGHPKRLDASVRQLIVSPIMEHSRKPDEVHDRIEKLVAGPYLELYARRERRGWVTWGNEIASANFANMIAADPDTGEIADDETPAKESTTPPIEEPPANVSRSKIAGLKFIDRVILNPDGGHKILFAECTLPCCRPMRAVKIANGTTSLVDIVEPLPVEEPAEIPSFLRRPVNVASPRPAQSVSAETDG